MRIKFLQEPTRTFRQYIYIAERLNTGCSCNAYATVCIFLPDLLGTPCNLLEECDSVCPTARLQCESVGNRRYNKRNFQTRTVAENEENSSNTGHFTVS